MYQGSIEHILTVELNYSLSSLQVLNVDLPFVTCPKGPKFTSNTFYDFEHFLIVGCCRTSFGVQTQCANLLLQFGANKAKFLPACHFANPVVDAMAFVVCMMGKL